MLVVSHGYPLPLAADHFPTICQVASEGPAQCQGHAAAARWLSWQGAAPPGETTMNLVEIQWWGPTLVIDICGFH